MRKFLATTLTIFVAVTVLSSFVSQAVSATTLGFKAGDIMDDSIMTNSSSMSVAQIQNFLNSKVPTCDTNGQQLSEYGGPDLNGDGKVQRWEWGKANYNQTTFICLRNYTENSKSAAQIIYDVAQSYKINPQVLIVLLQKEQGLVTDTWPLNVQYRTATGYACPDSTGCDTKYYGFTRQVYWAATMFHAIVYNDQTWSNPYGSGTSWYTPYVVGNNSIYWNPNTSCGTSTVNILNRTTVALYSYTPYRPNQAALNAGYGTGDACSSYGNRNFYNYFTDWFGVTTGTPLLKTSSSATVYLLSDTTRYGIASSDMLKAYGLDKTKVTAVSSTYLQSLTDGGVLGTTFMRSGSGTVYLADHGTWYGFTSGQQCTDWGFSSCLNTTVSKTLSTPIFNLLANGGALRSIQQNGSGFFLMKSGSKQPYLSMQAVYDSGYNPGDVTPLSSRYNTAQPYSTSISENNSLVKFGTNAAIYAYNQGKYYALTGDAFSYIKNVAPFHLDTISSYVTTPPTNTQTVGNFVNFTSGKEYLITNGKLLDISSVAANWPAPSNIDGLDNLLHTANAQVINISSTFKDASGSAIYKVESQKIRPFYSMNDFYALNSPYPTVISTTAANTLTTGAVILAPGAGSVYKTSSSSSAIFTYSGDSSICALQSLQQFKDFKFNANGAHVITPPSGTTHVLESVVKSANGDYYLVTPYGKSKTTSAYLTSTWGYSSASPTCSFTVNFLSHINDVTALGKFIRSKSGVIYYGDSGAKHPIASYSAYLRLGGTSSNTISVPDDFLNNVPTGSTVN